MSQVGLAGEGRLAVGDSMDPSTSVSYVGLQDHQSRHDPAQTVTLPEPPGGEVVRGDKHFLKDGTLSPTKFARRVPKDLKG